MGQSYETIFENNRKWIEEKLGQDADFFKKLAEGQSPEYLYIGCSDSRATAEELMGMKPGEVFVHRNIANLVNTLDMSSTAVIQYAVQHLKVKHIIVCGHYGEPICRARPARRAVLPAPAPGCPRRPWPAP